MAEDTGWHRAKVARVESGKYPTNPVEAVLYLGACGVHRAQALDLLQLCREAEHGSRYWLSPHGEWLEDMLSALIYHESTAVRSTSYEPLLIPGLLQTAAYARARISRGPQSPEEIEALVRVRLERQEILRRPRPARFTFFLQEHALRLRVGQRCGHARAAAPPGAHGGAGSRDVAGGACLGRRADDLRFVG